MIVVADAGPRIHLGAIGALERIRRLGTEVWVPASVFDEVVTRGAGLPGASAVADARWIAVVDAPQSDLSRSLLAGGLHRGESDAIALAVARGVDLLRVDERYARHAAERMGLKVAGSIGVVLAAKSRGDIAEVRPVLEALRRSGLWLTEGLVCRVLAAAGEGEQAP